MSFQLNGYLLEKPRVGASNSPYTSSPDDLISDLSAFNSAFPSNDEVHPGRTEYLVIALEDGNLPVVRFGWTKNETGSQRFDYDGAVGNFKPLPGSPRAVIGILGPDSNMTRLKILIPSGTAPYRIALGDIGSGVTFLVTTVLNDSSFGLPTSGGVEVSLATGNLNWNTGDLTTYGGQTVLFQQQAPFSMGESTGLIGVLGTDTILLNPIPSPGLYPLLKFGFGGYLTPIEVAFEVVLTDPPSGSFKWARNTGLVRFNPTDLVTYNGIPVYYDGILFEIRALPQCNPSGTIGSGGLYVSPIPLIDEDLSILAMSGSTIVHQFSGFELVQDSGYFTAGKSGSVQIAQDTGELRFYSSDLLRYSSNTLRVVFGDFLIENGVSIRFFRSPVNLDGSNPEIKDITAFYSFTEEILASPIIGVPMVLLPVLPVDDISHPMSFSVLQGTGTFIGPLPRLDIASPPGGIGYTLDFDQKQFFYASRVNAQITQILHQAGAVVLDPFISPSNASFELNQGAGYVPQVLGKDIFLDANAGVVSFITQYGTIIASGTTGYATTSLVFSDDSADFSSVQAGDLLIITAGTHEGVYNIESVASSTTLNLNAPITGGPTNLAYQIRRGYEVLADRYFQQVQFTDPHVVVQLVRDGSTTDLVQGKDYSVSAGLGTFQTVVRLLSGDQINLVYPSSQDNPDTTVLNPILTSERGTFLHRKELTVHTIATSVIPFNPTGLTVASNPVPTVYRGGRPQSSSQVRINFTDSTITFLPDVIPTPSGFSKVTDALPHGPLVNPSENVYIDYYTYEALGGENTVVILRPDLILTPVQIEQGTSSFTVRGDRTAEFATNYLIRIESEAVYYLTAPSYDAPTDTTTVNLLSPQVFDSTLSNPKIYISSGPVNISPTQPIYFLLEASTYGNVSRGVNQVTFVGDVSGIYATGEVMYFTVGGYNDFYLVSGSSYDTDSNSTKVTLTSPTLREYRYATSTLYRSIRPIYESTTTNLQTSGTPAVPVEDPQPTVLETVLLYRKIEGQYGQILTSPDDFSMSDTGKITLTLGLQPMESILILYSKHRIVQPGQLRSSYTHTIVPTKENGLLNQILVYTASTYIPDSFYVRVETMGNFRGQMAKKYQEEAAAAVPSSGPRVSNTSEPQLFEQGNKSVFYDEGEYANEDIVARTTLKFYNDNINNLEDILQYMEGRVVGDWDGRFKFDGTTGSIASSVTVANNQIDDMIQVSTVFSAYRQAYVAGPYSRFYPTRLTSSGITEAGVNEGDQIFDLGVKPVNGTSSTFFKKFPRAMITEEAAIGSTTLKVDTTAGNTEAPFRVQFVSGMVVTIADPSTVYLDPVTIGAVTSTTIGVPALTSPIPAGASVYLSSTDTIYQRSYRVGFDVTLDKDNGFLLYEPVHQIFSGIDSIAPGAGECLQGLSLFNSTDTFPTKFPALYGQPLDDSGDQRYPLINQSTSCEINPSGAGYNPTELEFVSPSGLLSTLVEDPFSGVGSLDVSCTYISVSSPFPSPTPKPGDLVRITSGLNVPTDTRYHVIKSVSTLYLLVETVFAVQDTDFNFEVTTSNDLVSGSTASTSGTILTDLVATFISSGVKPGHTVVATRSGPTYQRRQVLTVDSQTQLTLSAPFTIPLVSAPYRICSPLNTFSDISNLIDAAYKTQYALNIQISSITTYYDSVFTYKLSSVSGIVDAGNLILSPPSVDFISSGVIVGDYVYAPVSQTSEGIFQVTQIVDSHKLVVDGSPVAGLITFNVASVFGASKAALQGLFVVSQQCVDFLEDTLSWYSEVTSSVPVVPDTSAFADGLTRSSINARYSSLVSRQSQVTDAVALINSILSDTDKLYDSRYAWVDERINLQTGILIQKQRAVANRIKAQADALNAMIKLLAVQ
jgi:hypothetical protein